MSNIDIKNMPLETRENYDKLMTYLMNYAMFEHSIGVEFTDKLPPSAPPISYNKPGKLIIMNAKWIYPVQIPFLLAHEIGHVLHENACFYHISSLTVNKGEANENLFAIKLLQKYCVENEIYFDTWYHFAKCFGVPKECYYLLELIA